MYQQFCGHFVSILSLLMSYSAVFVVVVYDYAREIQRTKRQR